MGCAQGKLTPEQLEAVKRSTAIEQDLRKEARQQKLKILLLGAGETGKTTFLKQMKIINLQGFTKEERMNYQQIVYLNVFKAMASIVNAAKKEGSDQFAPESAEPLRLFETLPLEKESIRAARKLWDDPWVRKHYTSDVYFPFAPSPEDNELSWIAKGMDEVVKDSWVPTDENILHCRTQTTGINELNFTMKSVSCTMIDVGGQRSERRKWIHCFQEVTSVLFFVALSEYDQTLVECAGVNRMMESFKLFEDVCNCRWFIKTPFLLFLNKHDIFQRKIKEVDLNVAFPNYKGGKNYDEAIKFIKSNLLGLNKNSSREIYVHLTCATDTNNIRKVYDALKDILLSGAVNDVGL